jgi:hypothetical protein
MLSEVFNFACLNYSLRLRFTPFSTVKQYPKPLIIDLSSTIESIEW